MNTRFLTATLAASLALPLSAWGHPYGVTSVYTVPPSGPVLAPAPPAVAPVAPIAAPAVAPGRGMPLPPQYAPSPKRYSFDLRGFYGFRAVPHSVYATDMVGMEAEFAWLYSPRQALTLSGSFGTGGNDRVNYVHTPRGPIPVSEDFTRSDITLMGGYRFTQPLTQNTSISFSLKGGLDIQRLSYDDFCPGYDHYDCHSYGETRCGFAYAAAVTLETRLTQNIMLQLGYQFRGSTTKPDAPSIVPGGASSSAHSLRWHEVHLGLRFAF